MDWAIVLFAVVLFFPSILEVFSFFIDQISYYRRKNSDIFHK